MLQLVTRVIFRGRIILQLQKWLLLLWSDLLIRVSLFETNTLTDLPYPCPNLYLWKSPYTPFLLSTWWNEQELLYDNHLCINGSKIEETGFRYNYPELRIEFLREVSAPTLHRTQVVSKLCLRLARLYVVVEIKSTNPVVVYELKAFPPLSSVFCWLPTRGWSGDIDQRYS